MNFDILYSIAVDVIQKRSVQTQNVNDYVCVLMTQNNSIFTGISTSTIKDGKLVSVSAEDEAIRIMRNSNENKISALVVVNVHNLKPCDPCDSCKMLMLEINPENLQCLIMQEDKSFIPLSEIVDEVEQSIWDDGWDGMEGFNEMDSISTSGNNIFNPSGKTLNRRKDISSNSTSIDFNPVPQRNSMYTINSNASGYMESINASSTLQTAVVEKSNSTFARQANINSQQNSRFKEMLKDIIADDEPKSNPIQGIQDEKNLDMGLTEEKEQPKKKFKFTSSNSVSLNIKAKASEKNNFTEKKIPSKKELKLLAKERKKQAKKNIKILESMEKHSRT